MLRTGALPGKDYFMFDVTGSFAMEGAAAVIRYKAVNNLEEPILVAHLPSDARFNTYPNTAYCALSPDEQQVNLILGHSPLPYDCEVEFGVMAYFIKVPQGGHVTGEIRMAMPVQEWNGYFTLHKDIKTETVAVRQIILHIEVIPQSAVRWIKPARNAVDYWRVGGECIKYSLPLLPDALLMVGKRTDNFPRP